MARRLFSLFLVVVLGLFVSASLQAAKEKGTVTLGIVSDGPMAPGENISEIFLNELGVLAEKEFKVDAPASKRIDGDWSIDKIKKAIESLQNDPDVDIILALGPAASQEAILGTNFSKPVFAPFVINDKLLGLTRTENKTGVKNLNYLTSSDNFIDELKTFRDVIPSTRLVILIDETLYQAIPESARERAIKMAEEQGVRLSFIAGGPDVDQLISKIPADIQGVMIAPLPRLGAIGKKTLIEKIKERKLPSFGWAGRTEVEEGVLMSTRPSSDLQRIARRMALNIQAVLRGQEAADQPVFFERKRQLRINMGTARAIGVSPSFDILSEAILLNEDSEKNGSPLTLGEAAKESIKNNLSVIAGQLGVKANAEDVAIARSVLFPQVTARTGWNREKDSYPMVKNGTLPESYTDGAVTVNQIIFSESALANLAIQKQLHVARQEQQRTLELDIVDRATAAFLDVLVAETQLNIQQDNLALARANLDLAKDRVQTGTTDPSDIYRWETEIATNRQNVLAAKAKMERARDNLNLVLHRPISERYLVHPATLSGPESFIRRQELPKVINNPRLFNLMGEFLIAEGIRLSPELSELNARIKAQERQLTSDRLSFIAPDVSLTGDVSNVFDESRSSASLVNLENQTDWKTGIKVSLPLFEGGKRFANLSQSKLLVDQLRVRRDSVLETVEDSIRRNLHGIRASYPSIELSVQGAEAARKNFDLVRDNYARGKRSVVDLLDAQNASLAADQTAANAVYNYLIDLMKLQRSIGEFVFFLEDSRRDETVDRMMSYITKGGKPHTVQQNKELE